MAEVNRSNNKNIRFVSGLPIYIKYGANDWENLGENISNKLMRKSETGELTFKNGSSLKRRTKTSCDVSAVLAQVEKVIVDRVEELDGKIVKLYVPNGEANGFDEGYYFPEAELIINGDIDMTGDKAQELAIEFAVQPQTANVSIVPLNNLPSVCPSTSAAAVTGNKFFAIVKTAVAADGDAPPDEDLGG